MGTEVAPMFVMADSIRHPWIPGPARDDNL